MTQEVRQGSQQAGTPSVLQPFRPAREGHTRFLREAVETILLTLLVFAVVKVTVQPFRIDGPSMEPGLHTNEFVLVNQLAYRFGTPQRGDIIVFHPPIDPSEQYIKRVIGLPGDVVTITATEVFVDNVELHEPYVYPLAPGEFGSTTILSKVKIPAGEYFVLGDHRDNSTDSRVFGPVKTQNIIGKAEFVFWPADSIHVIDSYHNIFQNVHR
ncbi:MAG TPA: signal peptidase I [Ktedonobacterales bacterium]|nr:signal peptidase I [Ktedonobacterales bacterium]